MDPQPSFAPQGDDDTHTTEKLALALEAEHDPRLAPLIARARAGEFHPFISPLPLPQLTLHQELLALGHNALAERVANDDFDASHAEHEAWAASPEGQATFRELTGDGRPRQQEQPPEKPARGAAFWQQQRPAAQPAPDRQPAPGAAPAEQPGEEQPGVVCWVVSDIAADGHYTISIHFDDDRVHALDGAAAVEYAGQVLAACAAAEYDAVVFRQLTDIFKLPQAETVPFLGKWRAHRPQLVWNAGPLALTPGVNAQMQPFLKCAAGPQSWQWEVGQGRQHALQVLELATIVALDTGYRDFLIEEFDLAEDDARKLVAMLYRFRETTAGGPQEPAAE